MHPLAKLIWSTICEVAGKNHQESLVIGPTRATLREACTLVQEKLCHSGAIAEDFRADLRKDLKEACGKLDQAPG